MKDSLNIDYEERGAARKTSSQMPLGEKFRKWIGIDYWISNIGFSLIVLTISSSMDGAVGLPLLVCGVAATIAFANVKKYLFLTILGIYEKLHFGK